VEYTLVVAEEEEGTAVAMRPCTLLDCKSHTVAIIPLVEAETLTKPML
tara:strand:+ start:368 stop:511 length:144 start_codon:yes stop_codon:yes gene_type:complete